MTEQINPAVATAAVTSPWWLPALSSFSEIAAAALPIFGAVWLIVQIGTKLYETFRKE